MTAEEPQFEDARAHAERVRVTLLGLRGRIRERKQPPAADVSHCVDLIHEAEAEGDAADVAFIAGHLDEAIEHIDTALALIADAEACLELRSTLPT